MFEVKVKQEGGTMDKRHLERAPEEHGQLDDEAREFLDGVLADSGFEPVADRVESTLTTRSPQPHLRGRGGL